MENKAGENASFRKELASGEPVTRFFYEFQGERSVDPMIMIKSGIELWYEQVFTNQAQDNRFLWEFAESLLESRQDTPIYSWAEWLRYQIMMGVIVPEKWNKRKPYPYKGLLISAVYFQEGRRLCVEDSFDRAWHLIAMAYYHLGLNTTPSASQNAAKAAKMKHVELTRNLRSMITAALDFIERKALADSIEKAKDEVARLLREKCEDRAVKICLDEFDANVAKKTKGNTNAKQENDVIDRIRILLEIWSLPSGPYPEIAKAFSNFNHRKRRLIGAVTDEVINSQRVQSEPSECYLKIVNLREDGSAITTEISDHEAD